MILLLSISLQHEIFKTNQEMNNKETGRIINRHYIGVVKEVQNRLKFIEVEIPQENILIEEIEAMKENDNRTLMDVQQLFTEFYPEEQLKYKHYDYLYPNDYNAAYVSGVSYPKITTYEEYKTKLEEHDKWIRSEDYLFSCGGNGEFKTLKEKSEEKYKEKVDEIAREEMRIYIKNLRESFQCERFIYAHRYTTKLKEIKSDSNVKMWSTDQIGWKEFTYVVNDDITVYIKSNFGYGSASYFFCNLKYKDINILPYTAVIKYYYVKMVDFIRHTRRYGIDRSSWAQVFDFAVLTANMAKHEPDRFVKVWIVNEVEEMMKRMRIIMSSPKEVLEEYLGFNQEIEIGYYHIFRNCSTQDRKDYAVLPEEKIIAFKAEKITGCLFLLDNLRKLTEIAPFIVPYIEEIEQMNYRIRPEIKTHIDSLINDIDRLNSNMNDVITDIKSLEPTMEHHKKNIEEVRIEMNKKANEGKENPTIEYGTYEAEQKYKNSNPEYVKLKEKYDELNTRKRKLQKRIERRERFLKILNKCLKRIAKYLNAA